MGYCANGRGNLLFIKEEKWSQNQKEEMFRRISKTHFHAKLVDAFRTHPTMATLLGLFPTALLKLIPYSWDDARYNSDCALIRASLDDKYFAEDWMEFLYVISPIALKGSEIKFAGEDFSVWRFICLKNGNGFIEQQGHVSFGVSNRVDDLME